jgi:hypothetical protein
MQAKERVSLLLAICFLYLSQSSYVDQSKDKQEDSPEWVTHAGFVTLILTVPSAQSARFVRLRQVFQRRDTI